MVGRRLHVIGSYLAATAEDAMREMLARAGPHLAYLPDGETGEPPMRRTKDTETNGRRRLEVALRVQFRDAARLRVD